MTLEYYVGIKFSSFGLEYKSKPSDSAAEAFQVAAVGKKFGECRKVTFYIKSEEGIIKLPYDRINHLNPSSQNFDEELRAEFAMDLLVQLVHYM